MVSEVIANTDLKREKGFLYFVGTDDKGNLTIKRTKCGRIAKA